MKELIIILFFTLHLFASDKIDVLILHSYSQEYPWTKGNIVGLFQK